MSDGRTDPGSGAASARYPGTFMLAFREALDSLHWRFQRWRGHLVECVDEKGDEHVIGLENIYRHCRKQPRADWPGMIAEFLRTVGAADDPETIPEDLTTVADRLMVRVGPRFQLGGDAKVWSQPLGETGLHANLVIDFPDRMAYVTEELVADSGRRGEEWLERALANLRDKAPADCLEPIDELSGLRMGNVGDSYDSSRSLILDTLLPESTVDGCFVALPGRDQLFVLPVTGQSIGEVHLLKLLTTKSYQSAPYAISDEVFWVRKGIWHLFSIKVQGKQVTIEPPPEFLEVLDRLNPDADHEALA